MYTIAQAIALLNPSNWISMLRGNVSVEPPRKLHILSWNVDFMAPYAGTRMKAILKYISSMEIPPDLILFQEVIDESHRVYMRDDWVLQNYSVASGGSATPLHDIEGGYRTTALVSKSLRPFIFQALKKPYSKSSMRRDAHFIEFRFGEKWPAFRVINTHLESLPMGQEARKIQMAETKELLSHATGGVMLGDMNCISEEDEKLPERVGLKDLWDVASQGEGHTWGYQPPCEFPPGRLDKVLATENVKGTVQVVGEGLKASVEDGMEVWASDHYGLFATIDLYE